MSNSVSGKRIVVTGVFGFIGQHVAHHLASLGAEVIGIGRKSPEAAHSKAITPDAWMDGEIALSHLNSIAGEIDIIVHCAGSGSVARSEEAPYQAFLDTVQSTATVLEFARIRTSSIVLLSSAAVYGEREDEQLAESDPLTPISMYGYHKTLSEGLCRAYADRFQLNAAIVRFFSVYGPGLRKQIIWEACQRSATAGPLEFRGTGMEVRDFIYIADAVRLIEKCIDICDQSCPVINGGTGHAITSRQVIESVLSASHVRADLKFAGMSSKIQPVRLVANTEKAREIGFQPQKSFAAGVADYVDWFKQCR